MASNVQHTTFWVISTIASVALSVGLILATPTAVYASPEEGCGESCSSGCYCCFDECTCE
jgi:hypothetical protein